MPNQRVSIILLLLFGALSASHADTSTAETAGPWTMAFGVLDAASGAVTFGAEASEAPWDGGVLPVKDRGTVYRFRTGFSAPQNEPVSGFAFYVGPTDYPLDIRVNGILIHRTGRYKGDPWAGLTHNSFCLQIPWSLLRPGASNDLEVLAYSLYDRTPIPELVPTSADDASDRAFLRNMLNSWLILSLTVTSLIFAVYFMFLFVTHRAKDIRHFWFVLTCLAFGGAYCIFSFMSDNSNQLLFYKVARASLYFTAYFTFLFACSYTGIFQRNRVIRWGVYTLMGLLAVVLSFFIVIQPDKLSLIAWYARTMPVGLMFPLLSVFVIFGISLVRRRTASDAVLFFAFLIIIGTAVWDILFILRDRNPYMWMAPYGYALFLIANVFVLSREQAAMYDRTLRSDREIREKNRKLEDSMREKERVSEAVAKNTARVLEAASQISASAKAMYDAGQMQAAATGRVVQLLESYQNRLKQGLETLKRQDDSISGITASVEGLSTGIDRIAGAAESIRARMRENLDQSREGQERLKRSSEESTRLSESIRQVTTTVQQVGESAENIDAILRIIQGIVDQTNILSMNAAIEAAHAGEAGQGFAIVAGEVRKLADDSAKSVTDIESLVGGIRKGIQAAVKLSEEMVQNSESSRKLAGEAGGLLSGIVSQMGVTNDQVVAIAQTTSGQQESGKTVSRNALSVRDDAASILRDMENQAREASAIRESLGEVARLIGEGARASDSLSRLAGELKTASGDLSSLVQGI